MTLPGEPATPLQGGECKDGYIRTSTFVCGVFAVAKHRCGDESYDRPSYDHPPAPEGKKNGFVLDFIENNPFFFPWQNNWGMSEADIFEMNLAWFKQPPNWGPSSLRPTCSQQFAAKVFALPEPFLEFQTFAKALRTQAGMRPCTGCY